VYYKISQLADTHVLQEKIPQNLCELKVVKVNHHS